MSPLSPSGRQSRIHGAVGREMPSTAPRRRAGRGGTAGADTVDQQSPAVNGQPVTTVGHEGLGVVKIRHLHRTRKPSPRSSPAGVNNACVQYVQAPLTSSSRRSIHGIVSPSSR